MLKGRQKHSILANLQLEPIGGHLLSVGTPEYAGGLTCCWPKEAPNLLPNRLSNRPASILEQFGEAGLPGGPK